MLRRRLITALIVGPWALVHAPSFSSPVPSVQPGDGIVRGEAPRAAGLPCEEAAYGPCLTVRAPIDLLTFEASPMDGAVVLQWETRSEIDSASFTIHRRETRTGATERLNAAPIAAEGSPVSGAVYTFIDGTAVNGVEYVYVIEALGGGVADAHQAPGPVIPNPSTPPIRLISPSYGSREGEAPVLSWESEGVVAATLEISDTAGFPAGGTVWVPAGTGSAKRLDPRTMSQLREMVTGGDGGIYWRVKGRADDGSTVRSRTYFLILEP